LTAQSHVVHLVWAPIGVTPLRAFAGSYRAHPAGTDHRLLVVYNGFAAGADRAPWRASLDGLPHDELVLATPQIDLAAYRAAADELATGSVCFVNSYTVIEADGWLDVIDRHLRTPAVGMVGASGSYESGWDAGLPGLRHVLRRGFEPFPNPHIRTNGFAMDLDLLRELAWPPPRRKRQAYLLESGRHSITRQVLERRLEAVVVGRDGVAYAPERWRASATFRSGGQANRLFSDNRTRQYAQASPPFRAALERMCWGESDV
jgi:hypothetical protein